MEPDIQDLDLPPTGEIELAWWLELGIVAPTLCNVHRATGEFVGTCPAEPSPLEPGVWLNPAHAYSVAPPDTQLGFAALINRGFDGWELVPDHRGLTVYATDTGEPRQWAALGELPKGYTLQAPETEFDTWEDDKWAVDEAAQAEALRSAAYRKQSLLKTYASGRIDVLRDAVDLDMATDDEVAALKGWQVYRVELSRLDITAQAPAEDDWPSSPNDEALAVWLASQEHTQ